MPWWSQELALCPGRLGALLRAASGLQSLSDWTSSDALCCQLKSLSFPKVSQKIRYSLSLQTPRRPCYVPSLDLSLVWGPMDGDW